MNDELYDRWIQRAAVEPPTDFADRVMDAVRREELRPVPYVASPLLSSPALRIAACILACAAFLYRLSAVVAVFFVQ
jgi:hypothetical protein